MRNKLVHTIGHSLTLTGFQTLSELKKAVCCVLFLLFLESSSFSQNIAINSTGFAANLSAGLDISFTNRGLLIPRLTLAQRTTAGVALLNGGGGYYLRLHKVCWFIKQMEHRVFTTIQALLLLPHGLILLLQTIYG